MAHEHDIYDTDLYFTIDPVTRIISKDPKSKVLLIQNDHNSERFTFEMPRMIEGHDMSECDRVEIHYINVGTLIYGTSGKMTFNGVYEVEDMRVSPNSDDSVMFSWLISHNATRAAGKLSFVARFICLDGNDVTYSWNTGIYDNIQIGSGIQNDSYMVTAYPDILEAWKDEIEASVNSDVKATIMGDVGELVNEAHKRVDDVISDTAETVDGINKNIDDTNQRIDEVISDTASKIDATEKTFDASVAALDARVDSIVANANKTDGNSELVDVRLGADGTTYTSAGEAVRKGHRKYHGALNATAFISYNGTFDWSFDSTTTTFTFLFGGRVSVHVPGYLETAFTEDASWETLGSGISDHIYIGEDGQSAIVTMGSYRCLFLNTETGLLEIRATHNVPETGVVLIRTAYEAVVGGLLEEYRLSKRIEAVATEYAYVGDDGKVIISKDSSVGSLILTFNANGIHVNGKGYTFANCCGDISDYATVGNGTAIITIPSQNAFVVNTKTDSFELVANTTVKPWHLVLVRNAWSNYAGGLLDPAVHRWNTDQSINTMLNLNSVIGYTGSNAKITVTPNNSNGDLDIRFEGDHLGLRTLNGYHSITISEAIDNVSATMDEDGTGCTIAIGCYKVLVYRITTGKFMCIQPEQTTVNDIPLISNGWANFAGGLLMPYVLKQDLAAVDAEFSTRIAALEPQTMVTSTELEPYVQAIAESDADAFLFFTDPHTGSWEGWEANTDKLIEYIGDTYNRLPMDFCLCGGDWLNNSDTLSEACSMLGYFEGRMRSTFHNYHHLVGNHDYNYQMWNPDTQVTESSPYILTPTQMAGLWRNGNNKTYYTFKDNVTRFVVFDTGLDWIGGSGVIDAHVASQIAWFDEVLKNNTDEYLALALHIITNVGVIFSFTDKIFKMASAFNKRTSVTIDGVTYDYSSATGTVKFAIGGHTHSDAMGVHEDIPYIITTMATSDNVYTFDLISVDYASGILKAFRIGTGENREMNI